MVSVLLIEDLVFQRKVLFLLIWDLTFQSKFLLTEISCLTFHKSVSCLLIVRISEMDERV
mgnify:CR=1 FL=1